MLTLFYRLGIGCLAGMLAMPAVADVDLLDKLRSPDYVLVIRHALAPGTGDPQEFEHGNCETQRNLSARGRDQARRLGKRLKTAGISTIDIYTSQWCRCRQTAELMQLGPPRILKAINSFYNDPDPDSKQRYTRQWRQHLQDKPADHGRIYVTHQMNLSALLGGFAQPGEGYLLKIADNGDIKKIADIP